jgi:hypothetical protein
LIVPCVAEQRVVCGRCLDGIIEAAVELIVGVPTVDRVVVLGATQEVVAVPSVDAVGTSGTLDDVVPVRPC